MTDDYYSPEKALEIRPSQCLKDILVAQYHNNLVSLIRAKIVFLLTKYQDFVYFQGWKPVGAPCQALAIGCLVALLSQRISHSFPI
jgi:hypothetical protein